MLDPVFRIIALTRKELLAILKDPRGRASVLIPPILQCVIFGYAATYDLTNVPYAVLDQDRSAASRDLLAALDGSQVFRRASDLDRVAGWRSTSASSRPSWPSKSARTSSDVCCRAFPQCSGYRRRSKLQHRGHSPGLRRQRGRRVQRALAGNSRASRSTGQGGDPRRGITRIWRRAGT